MGQGIKFADSRIGDLAGLVDRGLTFAIGGLGDGADPHRFALVGIGVVGGRIEFKGLVFAQGDGIAHHHRLVVFTNDGDVHLGLGLGTRLVLDRVGEGFGGSQTSRQGVEAVLGGIGEGLAVIANGD